MCYFCTLLSTSPPNLPPQMYVALRCGIVHSFSLIPDDTGISKKGRPRSIILAYEKKGYTHFVGFKNNKLDSVIFSTGQFIKDIRETVHLLFQKAKTEKKTRLQNT